MSAETPSPTSPRIIPFVPALNCGLQIGCDPANYIDRFVLSDGIWEPLVVLALANLVQAGDTCIDVGANAGYQSLVMAALTGVEGRVIAFEPNLQIVQKLRHNISLNPHLMDSIDIIPCGLGNEVRTMFVVPNTGGGDGNAGLSSIATPNTTNQTEIRTLDSFCLERLNCMKVDVEGMELEVL